MKIAAKQASYGFCAGIFIVLAGTGMMMFWAKNQLEERKTQINEKRVESQEFDQKVERAISLREELEELSPVIEVVADVLPGAKSQENIVGEMLSIAAGRGVALENITFKGGSGNSSNPETSQAELVKGISGVYSIAIETSVQTDYENILQLLEDLENNKRQFEVQEISIAPIPEQPGQFNAQLTLVTYIQP